MKKPGGRRGLRRSAAEIRKVATTVLHPDRPLLVHIVPMRRCNLACAYCNEYDDHSDPVPTEEMFRRVDKLAELGTAVVTISGGEPLLHPDLDKIIARIKQNGMVCTLITNGYLLVPEQIRALNAAKLDRLQISIDNVKPDEISKKSLKVLDRKLRYLAELAEFEININSVIGAGVEQPEDALTIAKRATELGFTATLGVIHDGSGHLAPHSERDDAVYRAFKALDPFSLTRFNRGFQDNLAEGKANDWRCRAGGRYFYVCEDGLVHYCSQQRGFPGIPLAQYSAEDLHRENRTEKACAPFCTIACVHQASAFDEWRHDQRDGRYDAAGPLVQLRTPSKQAESIS
ncbi:MAG TPA: radical SAM protein [Polyangiales bacterium]|jgi:MoaA/NifB/PqqE/SkfB family radical SAM enzyme|nr:radical SAM protein [Polyangiales bacterium]